jgi:hypothetical protein
MGNIYEVEYIGGKFGVACVIIDGVWIGEYIYLQLTGRNLK